jgi:hypothetical protein
MGEWLTTVGPQRKWTWNTGIWKDSPEILMENVESHEVYAPAGSRPA